MRKLLFILLFPLFVYGQTPISNTSGNFIKEGGLVLTHDAVSTDTIPMTHLQLWLKTTMGISKDGSDYITNFADQSGNGNDATPHGTQPLWVDNQINGKAIVHFDGIDDMLLGGCGVTGTTMSTFIVCKPVTTADDYVGWALLYSNYQERMLVVSNKTGNNDATLYAPGSIHTIYQAQNSNYKIFGTVVEGDTIRTYYNGVYQNKNVETGALEIYQSVLGCRHYAGWDYGMNIDIAEVIVYDDTTRFQPITYLMNKYFPLPFDTSGTKMSLWLEADYGSTSNSLWEDRTVNCHNATQDITEKQPLYVDTASGIGGGKVRRFDGSNDFMSMADIDLGVNNTIFIIAKITKSWNGIVADGCYFLGNAIGYQLGYDDNLGIRIRGSYFLLPLPVSEVNLFVIYEINTSSNVATLYINGTSYGTISLGGNLDFDEIGSAVNGSQRFFGGDIAGIMIFNKSLTISEQDNTIDYIDNKYSMHKYIDCYATPMTSSTTPANIVTSSSGTNDWGAFDKSSGYWNFTSLPPQWITYQFDSPQIVSAYKFSGYPNYGVTAWTIEGSTNGIGWDLLDTRTGQPVAPPDITGIFYEFTNIIAYTYYKFTATTVTTPGDSYVRELIYYSK